MLKIHIPDNEFFDNRTGEFLEIHGGDVVLEHSLLSLYRWESKWKKSFLYTMSKKGGLSRDESIDYIRCMVVEGEIDPLAFYFIPEETMGRIQEYIDDPMTATTFGKSNEPPGREIITAEIIYWEMTVLGIPLEFEKRHLNHLFTLIKVCSIKNGPKEKMSKKEIYKRNRELNTARKKRMNSKG